MSGKSTASPKLTTEIGVVGRPAVFGKALRMWSMTACPFAPGVASARTAPR